MLVFDQTTSVVVYSFFQSPSLLDPEQRSNVPFRFTHCSRIRVQTDFSPPTFWMTMTDTELNWKSSLQPVAWGHNGSWLKGNLLFFHKPIGSMGLVHLYYLYLPSKNQPNVGTSPMRKVMVQFNLPGLHLRCLRSLGLRRHTIPGSQQWEQWLVHVGAVWHWGGRLDFRCTW